MPVTRNRFATVDLNPHVVRHQENVASAPSKKIQKCCKSTSRNKKGAYFYNFEKKNTTMKDAGLPGALIILLPGALIILY